MTQTIVKRPIPAADFDLILQILHLEPEGPSTTADQLKWNSAMRHARTLFEHKFHKV